MRQRNLKWAKDFLATTPLLVKEFPHEFKEPIEIEIGCGKGDFIKDKAKLNPDVNFFGIDVQGSCLAIAIKKATEEGLNNVSYALLNAEKLGEYFKPNTFQAIYLNFSDPWPKARHEKRRLTSPRYLEMFYNLLKEGGNITFKSDNVGLFAYSCATFKASKFIDVTIEEDYELTENEPISEYEKKFRALGTKIGRIKAIKK